MGILANCSAYKSKISRNWSMETVVQTATKEWEGERRSEESSASRVSRVDCQSSLSRVDSRVDKQVDKPMWSAASLDPVLLRRTKAKWPTLWKKISWKAIPNYQTTRFDCAVFYLIYPFMVLRSTYLFLIKFSRSFRETSPAESFKSVWTG